MARRKSPLRVRCKPLLFGMKACRWVCEAPLKVAQFQNRRSAQHYAIVHPSTKRDGWWQASFFDADGPISDVISPTCTEVLAEVLPSVWRLKDVI